MVKRVGKYELGKTLGEGTFGKVKFAVDTESGESVAIKVLEKSRIVRQGMVEQIKKEISIMKIVQHPHIVNLVDVLASSTKIYMVLELVVGGELFYKLASQGRFDEETARMYFQQLMGGVEYCHAQGVFHRDLKPENILLDADGNLKISDFGLSALHEEGAGAETLLHTTCGTPNYVAPEVISNHGYSGEAADIWSCGVILYVFLAGFLPFEDPNTDALFDKIQAVDYRMPSWFSDDAKSLVTAILVADPAQRATLSDIQAHPWYRANLDDDDEGQEIDVVHLDHLLYDFEQDVDEEGEEEVRKVTNAFDLIGMSGAFNLTRMLERNPRERVKSYTRFSTQLAPEEALDALVAVLGDLPDLAFKLVHKNFAIRVNASTPTGFVSFTIQIYDLPSENFFMVDFQKDKGSVFEFTRLYKTIADACGEIIAAQEGRSQQSTSTSEVDA